LKLEEKMKDKVSFYDTTLRDGAQTKGISFSVNDKLRITEMLDKVGIDYVEGGWPLSNPKDLEYFRDVKKLKLKNLKIAAFGSTRKADTKAADDPNLIALIKSETEVVTIFGKSWDLHVTKIFKTSLDENLRMIHDSVGYLKSQKRKVFYDAEHFFDGYKENKDYALRTISAAVNAGCDAVILCDTNGGTLPLELAKIVGEVVLKVPVEVGVHIHNDSDVAVANSIVGVQAGARQVQGTINGLGERCGNANLISVMADLEFKLGLKSKVDAKQLTVLSRFVADVCNMKQSDNQPFVGSSAFAHKAGVHVHAVRTEPRTYEHIKPELVGNDRQILVSELSGRTTILAKAEKLNVKLDKKDPNTKRILDVVQELEHQGYHFEAAPESFELLVKKIIGKHKNFFELQEFRVSIEKAGDHVKNEATIRLTVGNNQEHAAALGDGPVNALDKALRKALKDFYPTLSEMHLTDFRVRVLDEKEGTAAKVRVLIQSQDKERSWWTIGVSENIIEASWLALVDSVEYKLYKDLTSKKS